MDRSTASEWTKVVTRSKSFDDFSKTHNAFFEELEGYVARVFQHEFDHLDGILFPDRVSDKRFLIPNKLFNHQEKWDPSFPSPEAAKTKPGQLYLAPR